MIYIKIYYSIFNKILHKIVNPKRLIFMAVAVFRNIMDNISVQGYCSSVINIPIICGINLLISRNCAREVWPIVIELLRNDDNLLRCQRVVHTRCREELRDQLCDLGELRQTIIPPQCVMTRKPGNRNQRMVRGHALSKFVRLSYNLLHERCERTLSQSSNSFAIITWVMFSLLSIR